MSKQIVRITREQRQVEERRAAERRAAQQKALGDDLVKMASDWRQAETVRAFLRTVAAKVPEADRAPEFAAWLAWATEHVGEIDLLLNPDQIAKAMVSG